MPNFSENIAAIATSLQAINTNLTTINVAVSNIGGAVQGGQVTIDLSGIEQALQDLQFNSVTFHFGNLKVTFDGKTASLGI